MTALDGVPRYEDWMTDRIPSDDGEWVLAADAEAHERDRLAAQALTHDREMQAAVEAALDEAAILAQGPLQQAREQAIKDCIAAVIGQGHSRLCLSPFGIYDGCECLSSEVLAALRGLEGGN